MSGAMAERIFGQTDEDWLRHEFEEFFAQLPEAMRRRWNGKAGGLDITAPPLRAR